MRHEEKIKTLRTKLRELEEFERFLIEYHPDQGTALKRTLDLEDSICAILNVWYDVKVR